MENTTSSEFVEWKVYLEQIHGWQEPEKTDYYLAQIAAEIRRFQEGFSQNPKQVPNEDYLLKFVLKEVVEEEEVQKPRLYEPEEKPSRRTQRSPRKSKEPLKEYETGPELVKDSKWAKVNANAKSSWAMRFGVDSLESLGQEGNG